MSRMSGQSDGHVDVSSIMSLSTECRLHDIDPTKAPVCWLERRFLTHLMDQMNGLDVVELIPEDVKNFNRRMRARYNKLKGKKVLVHVDSGELFHVTTYGIDPHRFIAMNKKEEDFFHKIKAPKIKITLPLMHEGLRHEFLSQHSVVVKLLSIFLRDIDHTGV